MCHELNEIFMFSVQKSTQLTLDGWPDEWKTLFSHRKFRAEFHFCLFSAFRQGCFVHSSKILDNISILSGVRRAYFSPLANSVKN